MFAQTTHVVAVPHEFACVGIPATWLYIPSFIEICSGVSEPQGVKIWPFPLLWLFAFTTACTTVQAVVRSFVRSFIHSYIHLAFHASNGKQLKWVNCEVHRKSLTNNCIPRMTPRKLPPQTLQITYGCQSTRHMTNSHMVNSSKSQLVTVNSSHDQLVTRSSRHIVQLKSHG